MSNTPKLSLRGVSKQFLAARATTPTLAVADFALDVSAGEFVCIVGPSGCGKSTVMNMIAGLDTPSAGTIQMDGRAITGPGADRGVMFQDYALMPWQTVAENVGLPLRLLGRHDEARVQAVLDAVGLGGLGARLPAQLSGGQLQRVAIARAVVHEPLLILADEPTGNLDPANGARVLDLLATRIREAGAIGILVTHSLEAAATADRVLRLDATGLHG